MSVKIWTYNNVKTLAKTCTTFKEFREKSASAYQVANANNWMKDFNWLHNFQDGLYTYEYIKNIALKYTNAYDFSHSTDHEFYEYAKNKKWLKTFTWFTCFNARLLWDSTRCFNIAKKYNTLQDFAKCEPYAYRAAKANNWIIQYTWLSNKIENIDEHKSVVYSYEFNVQKTVYVGLTINPQKRHYDHLTQESSAVYRFCTENNIDTTKLNMKIFNQ